MRHLIVIFVLILGLTVVPQLQAAGEGPGKVNFDELKAMKESGEAFILIDSRGGKYFDGELIEGAKHLSVKDQTAENLAEIVPEKDAKIVFYCSNTACQASELAGFKAISAGYKNIFKYPGGIEEWKEKGGAVTKL